MKGKTVDIEGVQMTLKRVFSKFSWFTCWIFFLMREKSSLFFVSRLKKSSESHEFGKKNFNFGAFDWMQLFNQDLDLWLNFLPWIQIYHILDKNSFKARDLKGNSIMIVWTLISCGFEVSSKTLQISVAHLQASMQGFDPSSS